MLTCDAIVSGHMRARIKDQPASTAHTRAAIDNVIRLRADFTDEVHFEVGETWIKWENPQITQRTLRNYRVIVFCISPRAKNQGQPPKAGK